MSRDGLHDYRLFGLRVASAIPLPELVQAECEGTADVVIDQGHIDPVAGLVGTLPVEGGLLLQVPDVARYLISGGRRIQVDAAAGVPARNVRLFLLGSAFGALLHQRGLLPLHANAVEIDGVAVAFTGPSGAGKSTLAAWFHDNGYRVLADDVCAIAIDPLHGPVAQPGLPRLRLWPDAVAFTGRDAREFNRSYVGPNEDLEKYDVPLRGVGAAAPLPLRAIYLLERCAGFSVERLEGVAAADPIFANTYRGALLEIAGSKSAHWQAAARLAQSTPVFRACRSWELDQLARQAEALIAHARSIEPPGQFAPDTLRMK